ncbi:MAG: hypothetical protein V2I38_14490 [Alcanivoracaceae bacterium]|jgi:hypothetical protein|nr:hypothetical protein [Alcanivoracaceae bacterium]
MERACTPARATCLAIPLILCSVATAAGIGPDAIESAPLVHIGTVFTVEGIGDDNSPDDGVTTLREAIAQANANPGMDTIVFSNALANRSILTEAPYLITDDLQIDGHNAPGLLLEISANTSTQLLNASGPINLSVANISLTNTGRGLSTGVGGCQQIYLNRVTLSQFHRAIDICSDGALTVYGSELNDNNYTLIIPVMIETTRFTEIAIDRSIISNSPTLIQNNLGEIELDISGSILRGSSGIQIEGNVDMDIRNSSLIGNKTDGAFIRSWTRSYREDRFSDFEYYYPTLKITGVTASGNTSMIVNSSGSNTTIDHSTFYDNVMRDGSGSGYNSTAIIESRGGSLQISHTLIAGNTSSGPGIWLNDTNTTAEFSILPLINNTNSVIDLDATSATYLGSEIDLEPLHEGILYPPFHMPIAGSILISAGDPAAIVGSNGVPDVEQRGSSRIVGGGIEIGAVEFNSPPALDRHALLEELRVQSSALKQDGNLAGDIVLDLDDFVTEPDEHLVVDIRLIDNETLAFNTNSHVLSGAYSDFGASEGLIVEMEDETGLTGRTPPNLFGSSRSATGSLGALALMFASGLLWRRRT